MLYLTFEALKYSLWNNPVTSVSLASDIPCCIWPLRLSNIACGTIPSSDKMVNSIPEIPKQCNKEARLSMKLPFQVFLLQILRWLSELILTPFPLRGYLQDLPPLANCLYSGSSEALWDIPMFHFYENCLIRSTVSNQGTSCYPTQPLAQRIYWHEPCFLKKPG